jgi:hypothetical protein
MSITTDLKKSGAKKQLGRSGVLQKLCLLFIGYTGKTLSVKAQQRQTR